MILRTPPLPPPRNTSIRNGMFKISSSSSSSVDKPSSDNDLKASKDQMDDDKPPPVFPRHLSLGISRQSTIEDPWIKHTPTPEVSQITTHPLTPTAPLLTPTEARQSINLLSDAPTMKRAERKYFTPSISRADTMRPADKESLLKLFKHAKANTLPISFSKINLTFDDFKKYLEEDASSSSDDSDSDDTESTLATDSDWEDEYVKFIYGEDDDDSPSEPSSLDTCSDSDEPPKKASVK